jgi:superfamily II DNA or RNA helicase
MGKIATGHARAFAPGARVQIRDEEWIVRSAAATETGGQAVKVVGTSELVRNKQAIFLTDLDDVVLLLPEETQLVPDPSPRYRKSRLFLESLLRRSPPTGSEITIGHQAAIEPSEYQLQPAAKALRQTRPRMLFADGVGLGKTIEVGILLSELIKRGRGDRILVVALKSILAQFQQELWARFTIPLVRLDSVGIQRVQSKIPSNMNPFYFYDRAIISIDTLKKDVKYRRYLEKCHWDVIVIDECQNVAVRGKGTAGQESQRARLARLLSSTCDSLILTSATPHDGSSESFASLMNLLEPTAVADPTDYTREEIEDFFIRRFKKDVKHEVAESFQERLEIPPDRVPASDPENRAFETLSKIEFRTIDRRRQSKGILFRTLLLKAFLSSPSACAATIRQRLRHKDLRVEDESGGGTGEPTDPAAAHDREVLTQLLAEVEAVKPSTFAKYQKLLERLRAIGLDQSGSTERVVIFSERIDTLNFLEERLRNDLKLKNDQIEIFHGTLDDQTQKRLVQEFGTEKASVRVLLASDAASEGINLHYYCHRLIHFDLPWSLITLEQRNGRIDRFGQAYPPELYYLLTIPTNPDLQGDLRVLERLIEKESTASQNLGDTAWLLNLHDAEREEEHIATGIEEGKAPEEIIPEEPVHTDFMELLFGDDAPKEPAADRAAGFSLFANDLGYAKEALREVLEEEAKDTDVLEWHDHLDGFSLRAPDDLKLRFEYLPPELQRDDNRFLLTADRSRVMDDLAAARQDEGKWPESQLFWELHPIAQWIDDRVQACFQRHEAPIVRVDQGLGADETMVIVQAVLSNRRSQPALAEWFGVGFEGGRRGRLVPFAELAREVGLDATITNPGREVSDALRARLSGLLPSAVDRAHEHVKRVRGQRAEQISGAVEASLLRLRRWKNAREERIGEDLAAPDLAPIRRRRLEAERHETERLYEQRKEWVESLQTIPVPYLRVAAVLISPEA